MKHVDDFIDDYKYTSDGEKYARWVLHYFRLPADLKQTFTLFMADRELYCTWEGKRWRVTGCSATFGDVWLRKDFKKDFGYDERVPVDDCSEWGALPDAGALSEFERKARMLQRASDLQTVATWLGEKQEGRTAFLEMAGEAGTISLCAYTNTQFQESHDSLDSVLFRAASWVRSLFKEA